MLDAVSELAGIDTVDLMVLNRAGPVARERALVGCLLLYEGRAGVFANAQIAA